MPRKDMAEGVIYILIILLLFRKGDQLVTFTKAYSGLNG